MIKKVLNLVACGGFGHTLPQEGRLDAAAHAARAAHVAAESAFFHPDIISLLYFPSEYMMAVYIPLFLPTLLPIFSVWTATVSSSPARSAKRTTRGLTIIPSPFSRASTVSPALSHAFTEITPP